MAPGDPLTFSSTENNFDATGVRRMKAAYIQQPGPPENIQFGDLPRPEAKPGQVLVRVRAVAVNPIDTYIRAGMVPMEIPRPYILGSDLAGVVESLGPGVTRFHPGDRVWGSNQGFFGRQGTFAEYAVVDQQWLHPTPVGATDQQMAALGVVGITAHMGLFDRARLASGETLFVHGGSGGVGSCVVQMGKAAGARVITTAGSEEKARICRDLGADVVIDYHRENVDEVLDRTAPKGVDVWYETLRQQDFNQIVAHLAERGRIVVMAGRDARPPFPVGPFYTRNASLFGFAMLTTTAEEQQPAAEAIRRWLAEGKLRAQIGRVLPLSQAAEAHRLQEAATLHQAGNLNGKIVLET
jgi:NADPH2:quinone reductase